ncbi:MAG: phosphoribosylformylglycinamidine synthase subunit PurQ, partial [Planctomycetota bacterium]
MAKPRVLIVRAPGTNCDVETEYAFELAGAETQRLHVNQIIDHPRLAERFQILCFPGGFSYGDDIAAGRIAAVQWQTRLSDTLAQFRSEDRLVLGICNGFQIMMRLGIFFDEDIDQTPATLTWNRQARFETRWVHLKPESDH